MSEQTALHPVIPDGDLGRVAGGIPIAFLPYVDRRFLGSPAIVISFDGAYVVSLDVFGKDSTSSDTYVYESTDSGASWREIAHVPHAFWSSLFAHGRALYLLGTSTEYGALLIRRSDDGGATWTVPRDCASGLISSDARFHTAPVPVVEHRGRLWRAFEITTGAGSEWGRFSSGVMSALLGSDLLDAANWTLSPPVEIPARLAELGCPTWLEGNVVIEPGGSLVNILRAQVWDRGRQFVARLPVDVERNRLSVDPESALRPMPGGGSKFSIRFDPVSHAYYSLANTGLFDSSPTLGLRARNTLSLIRSRDLAEWEVLGVVAHHPDDALHGFQYADWVFDHDDIIAVVRTASDFAGSNAHSYHDSNLITFHRIERFRSW